jgi:hypothetical protein
MTSVIAFQLGFAAYWQGVSEETVQLYSEMDDYQQRMFFQGYHIARDEHLNARLTEYDRS